MNSRSRTTLLATLGAAGIAFLAIPTLASATSSAITLDCDRATFTYSTFGPPPQAPAPYTLTVDGAPFTSPGPITRNGVVITPAPFTLTPSGPLTVFVVPLNLQGRHVVAATTSYPPTGNAFSSAGPVTLDCLVTPPPPKPPELVPPPPPPPVVTPPKDCVDWMAQRPRIGKRFLIDKDCIEPAVRRKIVKRSPTCATWWAAPRPGTFLARDGRYHLRFVGGRNCGWEPPVTGEYRVNVSKGDLLRTARIARGWAIDTIKAAGDQAGAYSFRAPRVGGKPNSVAYSMSGPRTGSRLPRVVRGRSLFCVRGVRSTTCTSNPFVDNGATVSLTWFTTPKTRLAARQYRVNVTVDR